MIFLSGRVDGIGGNEGFLNVSSYFVCYLIYIYIYIYIYINTNTHTHTQTYPIPRFFFLYIAYITSLQ
jgi:hypothetical protein